MNKNGFCTLSVVIVLGAVLITGLLLLKSVGATQQAITHCTHELEMISFLCDGFSESIEILKNKKKEITESMKHHGQYTTSIRQPSWDAYYIELSLQDDLLQLTVLRNKQRMTRSLKAHITYTDSGIFVHEARII